MNLDGFGQQVLRFLLTHPSQNLGPVPALDPQPVPVRPIFAGPGPVENAPR